MNINGISTKYKSPIYHLRLNLGENQGTFAKRFGVSHSTISQWENGRSRPNAKAAKKLAELSGESINKFLFY